MNIRKGVYLLSLLLIFTIPWEGVVRLPVLGTGARVVGMVVAVVWVMMTIFTNHLRKPTPFHAVFGLFVLWNATSVLWSTAPNRSVAQVFTWVQLAILVFIFWDLYISPSTIATGLQTYVFGAYIAVSSAIYNLFRGQVFYTNYERFSPGETNPDGFGFIVVLAIPIAWHLAVSEPWSGRWSHLLRLINYSYIPAALLGVALSGTRTAMLAAIPGMAFGLASLSRPRLAARVSIFIFLSLCIVVLLPYVQNLTSFQRLGTTGAELAGGELNQRADLWRAGFASFVEHPLIGIGTNNYRSINELNKVAHNSFLSVLVELGIIGFMLFATILTIVLIQILRMPTWTARFWITMLAVWAIGASTLTWEHRKTTWLFLSLIIANASLVDLQPTMDSLNKQKQTALSYGLDFYRNGFHHNGTSEQTRKKATPV